jgi:hypothetical protein
MRRGNTGEDDFMKIRSMFVAALTASFVLSSAAAADAQPMKVRPITLTLPDLVVDDLRLDSSCFLEVKVRNKGGGAISDENFSKAVIKAKAGKKKKYKLSSLGGCGAVKSAGGSAWCATPLKVKGSKTVKVEVDPKNKLLEENENNNARSEDLVCGEEEAAPGVPVKSRVPGPPPTMGKKAPAQPGMEMAPLKPATMKAVPVTPQGGGGTPPEGGDSAFGRAVLATPTLRNDPPRATEPVLSILTATVSPAGPPQGGTGVISFTIRNTGGSPSPGPTSFGLQVYSSDAQGNPDTGDFVTVIPWYTNNIPVLSPGQDHTISAPVYLQHAGPHTANGVIITEGYNLGEVSTFKSPWNLSFQVSPRPDLVVCFKKHNHVSSSQQVTFPPKVRNLGSAPSTPVNLSFWIEGKGTENYTIPVIDPGDEYAGVQRSVYWSGAGAFSFSLIVDSNNDVGEVHETNNVIEGFIAVGAYGSNSETLCSDQPGMTGP